MKPLKIKDIRTDAGTQIRVRLNDDTVKEYAEAYQDGAKFPPVVVFHDGTENILADGFHRVMGAISAGLKDVLADVRKGSRVDALKYALGANANHGLKRTNADKRRAAEVAIKEFGNLTDGALAELCGVSRQFITDVRPAQVATVATSRVGRDGKKYPVPPPPVKKSAIPIPVKSPPPEKAVHIPIKAEPVKSHPPAPPKPKEPESVLDKTGWAIPAKLLDLWNRSPEVQEILTTLSRVKSALKRAQEDKDKLYLEINFSSALSHLEQAWTDIKTALPFAVCPTCQGKTANCTLCKSRGFISEFKWQTVVPKETKEIRKKAQQK